MTTVLITRPKDSAATFAREVQNLGYTTLSAPLFTYHPTALAADIKSSDAFLITSARALKHPKLKLKLDTPVYCTGTHTAQAAKNFGFKIIETAFGDSQDVAELVLKKIPNSAQITHICGTHTKDNFYEFLRSSGYGVDTFITYDMKPIKNMPDRTRTALENNDINIITFFSERTAAHFLDLCRQDNLISRLKDTIALCMSKNIATLLSNEDNLHWMKIITSDTPTQAAVLDRLQHLKKD